jgi:hypothetical protein
MLYGYENVFLPQKIVPYCLSSFQVTNNINGNTPNIQNIKNIQKIRAIWDEPIQMVQH